MSSDTSQTDNSVFKRIAFISVVVFGLVIAYAVHTTSQTVNEVEANHYPNQNISIEEATSISPSDESR